MNSKAANWTELDNGSIDLVSDEENDPMYTLEEGKTTTPSRGGAVVIKV